MWHVSSRSGVATLRTAMHLLLTYLLTTDQGLMKLSSVRPSVRLSVCPIIRPLHAAAVGLLLWARRPGDIDQLLDGRRSAAAANAGSATLSVDAGS